MRPASIGWKLNIGQVICGKVLSVLGEGRFLLRLEGCNLIAQSDFPFKEGDQVRARVQTLNPRVTLKILLREPEIQAGAGFINLIA